MTILDSAEWLRQMKNYSGSGDLLDEANSHDAQFGSTAGADTNDPLDKDYDGFQYLFLSGNTDNDVEITSPPAAADINDEDIATIAVWMRIPVQRTFDWLFATRSSSGVQILFGASAGQLQVDLDDGPTVVSTAAVNITVDTWHHVALVVDHTSAGDDEMTLYVDGSAGTPVDISALGDCAADGFIIGSQPFSTVPYLGDIATFEFYKDLATASEISDAWNGGVGTLFTTLTSPVSAFTFADTAMVTQPYASFTDPQSNSWTFSRSASGLVATVVDRAWALLTTDDFFEIPDDAGLDFAAGDAGTWMVMFRTNTVAAGEDVLLSKKDDLTTSAGYALTRSTATGKGIIADGTLDDDDTVATVAIHTLHTLAMVRNTVDDDIEVFLDGVPSGSATTDSTTATLANALVQRLGATSGATPANFFEGVIGADAGWRFALTDADIVQAHNLLTLGLRLPKPARLIQQDYSVEQRQHQVFA